MCGNKSPPSPNPNPNPNPKHRRSVTNKRTGFEPNKKRTEIVLSLTKAPNPNPFQLHPFFSSTTLNSPSPNPSCRSSTAPSCSAARASPKLSLPRWSTAGSLCSCAPMPQCPNTPMLSHHCLRYGFPGPLQAHSTECGTPLRPFCHCPCSTPPQYLLCHTGALPVCRFTHIYHHQTQSRP